MMVWAYVDTGKWVSDCEQYRIKIREDGCFDLSYGGYDDNDEWVDIEDLRAWSGLEAAKGGADGHKNERCRLEIERIKDEILKRAKSSDYPSVVAAASEMILELREAQRQG